ncbi:hypothetical protein [Gorillibacterium sp. sgz5001074]
MKYDWNKDWYEGHMPADRRTLWRKYPLEAALCFLLAAALLLLWGIS